MYPTNHASVLSFVVPASPFPASLILVPSSTPLGIVTEIFSFFSYLDTPESKLSTSSEDTFPILIFFPASTFLIPMCSSPPKN